MSRFIAVIFFATVILSSAAAQEQTVGPLLIQQVTASRTHIAFSHAGDIWTVERSGGQARKITTDGAEELHPRFSPDGRWLAFSRIVAGSSDVFVMPAAGGEAKRLTWYPKSDQVRGWTTDSRSILFSSRRDEEGIARLYTVAIDGVMPEALRLPIGANGSFSPDGARIAYTPNDLIAEDGNWRHYRGGIQSQVWITRLSSGETRNLTTGDHHDRCPMWIGDRIYFLSDRTATYNLFVHDLRTNLTRQLTTFEKYGITAASATADAIVFARDGRIYLFDLKTSKARAVDIQLDADKSELKPREVNAARWIASVTLSSAGDRAVFEARGDVFIVDAAKGEAKNITRSSNAADRFPALSPDGRRVAYFSDESGEYQLVIRPSDGEGAAKRIAIEQQPTFYRELVWSPDSRKIAFSDKRLSVWIADVEKGAAKKIDASPYSYQEQFYPSWSPDGRFLAYSKCHSNRLRTVYIYDSETAENHQVTDGAIHAEFPVFDRSGKYLYFTSSTAAGASEFGWGVLSGLLARPLVTRRLHVVTLRSETPSPLLSNGQPNPDIDLKEAISTRIDFKGLEQRVITFPMEARDYIELVAGKAGVVYALVNEWPKAPGLGGGSQTAALYRYDITRPRNFEKMVEGLSADVFSQDGSRLLYRKGAAWFLVSADAPPKADEGRLDLKLETSLNPRAEWRQIYREAWRMMRDYFYDPNHHGQNLAELEKHYREYLPFITRREDLNTLMMMALGHVSVSHFFVGGGDTPPPAGGQSRVGLLGADFQIEEGRYKIARVLRNGHYASSNPLLRAPLDQPGMNVREGEYLLAVDGEQITASKNILSYFEGKTSAVKLLIGPKPDGEGARAITAVTLAGEQGLRRQNWAERNRRLVEERSGGRIGYIYVQDFGQSGLEDFFRGVYGYRDNKRALIIDQRFNSGGVTSDFLIEMLRREPIYYYRFRDGEDIATPTNPVTMPKVLIINEMDFSAGETFPFMFKLAQVGTIVGRRTGGGGIGPYVFTPRLIDSGRAQIPNRAAFDPRGAWGIENHGVEPDIVVDIMPADFQAGRDPQLERAIEVAMKQMQLSRPPAKLRPRYPVHK
jgi:tricorn protease